MRQILVELRGDAPVSDQMAEVRHAWQSGRFNSLLIHIFSGLPDESRLAGIARELKDGFETAVVVGTMSAGEIRDGRLMAQGILVSAMLFEEARVRLLRFDGVMGREAQIGGAIRRALDAAADIRAAELLFPGTEMDTQPLFAEISRCDPEIQIFGGYTGGHGLNSRDHFVFDSEGVTYDSILAVIYAGRSLHIDVDKSIGWDALGMPFKVTKAHGKHLMELDGKPAAQIYEKFLKIDRKNHNNAEDASEFPLIVRQGQDERLRSTVHIEEDGSLTLHGFVNEGMDLYLSCGNPTNIVETVNRRLEAMRRFKPQAILLYSCMVRKSFWEDFVDMEMEPFARIASTAGFHTWGEILRDGRSGDLIEHNITLLSIGLREGDAPAGELPESRVDDTVLQGQASLIKHMTRLVFTTMGELQKAHSDLSALNQKLTVMAEHDALTGLYNRGKMELLIDDALDRSADRGGVTSLVMMDLDRFKRINDTYGHDAGDDTLRHTAALLNTSIEGWPGAQIGRWGGEEFFTLLPDVDEDGAMRYAAQLNATFNAHSFPEIGRVTCSQGVITVRNCRDYRLIYNQVDNALYKAKKTGRNRIVQADSID